MTLFYFDPTGEAITDEKVLISEPFDFEGTTYYRGFLNYIPNANIQSSANGIYTATSKGGTEFTLLLAGMPEDANTLTVDLVHGYVISTVSAVTCYANYTAHAPSKHSSSLTIDIPFLLTSGETTQIASYTFPSFQKFKYCSVSVDKAPDSAANVTLSNGVETQTIEITNGLKTFTDYFKVLPTQTLSVYSSDGKNASEISLTLQDV